MHPKILLVVVGQAAVTFVILTMVTSTGADTQAPPLNKFVPSKQPKFDSRTPQVTTVAASETSTGKVKSKDTRVLDLLDPKTMMNTTSTHDDSTVSGNSHRHQQSESLIKLNNQGEEKLNIISDERMVTWVLGFVFVTIINLSSILGAILVPFWTPNIQADSSKDPHSSAKSSGNSVKLSTQESFACSKLHNALEGLAFGSLLASSIFHLVPHAFDLVGQDGEHEYLYKSLLVFAGIYLFYWLERILILLTDSLEHFKFAKCNSITGKLSAKDASKLHEQVNTNVHLANSHSSHSQNTIDEAIHNSIASSTSRNTLTNNSICQSSNSPSLIYSSGDFNLIQQANFMCQKLICKKCNSIYSFQFTNQQQLFHLKRNFICSCSQSSQFSNSDCNLDGKINFNRSVSVNSVANSSPAASSSFTSPVVANDKINSSESLHLTKVADEKWFNCSSQFTGLTELTGNNWKSEHEESIDGDSPLCQKWPGKLSDNLNRNLMDNSLDNRHDGLKSIAIGKSSENNQLEKNASKISSNQIDNSKFNLILMVILGDAVHNFIDGLSLGAGLIDSHLTGCSIATAILFEEIPHELGDFWILLSSGMSIKSAIKLNLLSSLSCYAGLVGGLIIGENWGGNSSIFAITAGMFIYIALFNVLSDLKSNLDTVKRLFDNSIGQTVQTLIWQNIGIITGVALLYQLAIIDERLLFQSLRINL